MQCPQCGATLHKVTEGDQHDTLLRCAYCGYQQDVPDSTTITEEEVVRDADGRVIRRRVVRRHTTTFSGAGAPDQLHVKPDDDFGAIVEEMRRMMGEEVAAEVERALGAQPDDVHDFHFSTREDAVEVTDVITRHEVGQAAQANGPVLIVLVGAALFGLLSLALIVAYMLL